MKKLLLLLALLVALTACQSVNAQLNKAKDELDAGNYEKAIEAYGKAIEIDDQNFDAYYSRGVVYVLTGDYEKAIPDFDKAIELNNQSANAYYSRGIAHVYVDNKSQAVLDFNDTLRLDAKNADAYYQRGSVYLRAGNFDGALPDFSSVITLLSDVNTDFDVSLAQGYRGRGLAYYGLELNAQALRDLKQYLELRGEPDPEIEAIVAALEA